MKQIYRVIRPLHWDGKHYGPRGVACVCGKEQTACPLYEGDILVIDAGHPRKDFLAEHRYIVGDASLPPVDEFLKEKAHARR